MLDEPRELLLRALLPLYPPEPPNPLEPRDPPPLETLRLPTRSPPPPPPPPRCDWFWRACDWRVAIESPRAVPPYLLAVALFE